MNKAVSSNNSTQEASPILCTDETGRLGVPGQVNATSDVFMAIMEQGENKFIQPGEVFPLESSYIVNQNNAPGC